MKTQTSFAVTTLLLALCSFEANAVDWTITDLGSADGVGTMALNDNGWVVFGNKVLSPNGTGGYSTTSIFNAQGNNNNFALYDINNNNTVVGIDRNSGSVQGFVWSGGTRKDLPMLWDGYGWRAEAKGINDSGQVVGNAGTSAAIWSPIGSGYNTPTPLGWYWEGTSFGSGDGVSINNNGFGLMTRVYGAGGPGYTNGSGPAPSAITILAPGQVDQPLGVAINDRFAVAGYDGWYNCGGYSCDHPFIWTSGNNVALLPLSPVAGKPYNGRAYALNEDNDVVGMGWYNAYDARAVLWSATPSGWQEIDLNTLLPTRSNFYKLATAMDINEKGQILGMGSVYGVNGQWEPPHAFLLTPAVPEPETWVMLLAGLGLVGFATRQTRRGRSMPTS